MMAIVGASSNAAARLKSSSAKAKAPRSNASAPRVANSRAMTRVAGSAVAALALVGEGAFVDVADAGGAPAGCARMIPVCRLTVDRHAATTSLEVHLETEVV